MVSSYIFLENSRHWLSVKTKIITIGATDKKLCRSEFEICRSDWSQLKMYLLLHLWTKQLQIWLWGF